MVDKKYLLKAALEIVGYKCTDSDTLDNIFKSFGNKIDSKASVPRFLSQMYQLIHSTEFQNYMTQQHLHRLSNIPMPSIDFTALPELEPYDNQYENQPEQEQQYVNRYLSRIAPPRPY